MSGNDFGEFDSDFALKKLARMSEGVDRISKLPDDIIVHILSFIPFKEVVATSVLSSRWSSLWKYTPNLIFVNNRRNERRRKTIDWINPVLRSYKGLSLKQFTVSFYVHRRAFYQVSEWLEFPFSRRVESLKLDFEGAPSVLENCYFTDIRSSDYIYLKELTLGDLLMSGEAIELLLRNCSVLERLIMNATLFSDLVVSGSLKYLEIYPSSTYGKSIKVCAPNLTRLPRCNCDFDKLFFENVPNLVEASFELFGGGTLLHFAKATANLESLAIILDQPPAFPVPQMPKLKKFVLDYASVKKQYLLPVTHILQACPCLEEFILEISDEHEYHCHCPSTCKAIFEVPKLGGGFQHQHLNVFELSGFCDRSANHVKLVRYIAKTCVALKKIIITPLSASVARQFLLRSVTERLKRKLLAEEVDVVAEEQDALHMKKATEKLFAGKLPNHIKLLVN